MADGILLDRDFYERLWLVTAEDPFVCEENRKLIRKICIRNGIDEDSVRTFDLKGIKWDEVRDILSSIGFFGERLVLIRGSFTELNDENLKELTQIISEIDYNRLAVVLDVPDPKKADAKKYRSLYDTVSKRGKLFRVPKVNDRFLASYLVDRAGKMGKKLSRDLAFRIVNNVGNDLGLLSNEIDKYCFSEPSDSITARVVDGIGIKNTEASVFDIVDRICRGKVSFALKKTEDLFSLRTDEISVLSSLSTSFVDMHRCKLGRKQRKNHSDVHADFESRANRYRYQKASRNSNRFTLEALNDILHLLLDTDIRFKSASMTAADRQKRLKVLITRISFMRS